MLKNYSLFRESMILRDYLALDRTILANERTFLAYLRTFIGFLASGVAALKLLDGTPAIRVLGWLMIAASPFFLVLGSIRYATVRKKLYTLGHTGEGGQSIVTKTKNASGAIKNGAQDVGQDVKQTAVNISQNVTSSEPPHQTEKTYRKQS